MDEERVKDLGERGRERKRGERGVDIRINRAKLLAIQPKSMFLQQCYQPHSLGAVTLSTTTLRIRTLCIVTLRIRALSIMALRM